MAGLTQHSVMTTSVKVDLDIFDHVVHTLSFPVKLWLSAYCVFYAEGEELNMSTVI